jgi:GntR family transcriptional regulator
MPRMVDPFAPEPLRDQAAAMIRAMVAELGPRQWLPSQTTLTQELGVSRDTLRRALMLVRDEAIIASRWGRGWFVTG